MRRAVPRLAAAAAALLFLSGGRLVAAPAPVDMALVLAVDVSESVDQGEYVLQHDGIARAFEDPQIAEAIAAGKNGAIEVAVIEWSDPDKQTVTVGWTRIADRASARAFAAKLRTTRRTSHGLTAIGNALLAAKALLDRAPAPAARRLVDVSGDGMANIGPPVPRVRDALVAAGITINGLAILASEPWLDSYYQSDVIGGADAFLIDANDFAAFATAVRTKLLGEISVSGLPPPRLVARVERAPARRGGAAATPLHPSADQMQ